MEQQGSLNAETTVPRLVHNHPQNRPPAPRIYLWRLAPVFLLALGVFLLSFFCLLGFPSISQAAANYRYVALTGNDSSPDCSVSAPCRTIWRAITFLPVDEIRVAAGRYTEIITINNSISLRGGFTTTNWIALPDPVKNVTIIDAQDLGRVIYHTSISTTVSGFHLTGGRASVGAGVYNLGTLTLENNKIYNNNETGSSDGGGGVTNGAFGTAATLILKHNQIYSNTAADGSGTGYGGGVSIINGSALIEANEIFSNSASFGGGGWIFNGDAAFKNNFFYNNVSTHTTDSALGGGFVVNNGTVSFENNTFYKNKAKDAGGGLYIYNGIAVLTNNLIISNTSSITNGGIHRETATLNLSFTDFFGNLPNNGFTTGSNNRTNQDYSNFNLYLTAGSPAIDSGAITTTVTTDIQGEGRPFGSGIDRGADEYTAPGGICFARPAGGQVYTDVQKAINAVSPGGVVQVAGWCQLTQTVNISRNLTLRGGYTVTDWLNPAYGPTVLDGQGQRQVIYITHTTGVTLENLHIVSGSTTTNGAGIYINNSVNTTLQNNVIAFNRASSSNGGGIYVDNSNNTVLQHNTIYSNTANQGGGVYANVASVTLRNSLVVSNSGGGLYQGGGGSFSLGYNDFFGNSVTGNNVTPGPTDISVWPGLANPANLNFHLLYASSQVIGQADPNSPIRTDFENDTRPQGACADIGADESLSYAEVDLSDAPYFRITDIDAIKGKTITFTHTITNMGYTPALTDSFDIQGVNSDGWTWSLVNVSSPVVLATGESKTFQVVVTVPLTPPVSIFNRTTITATSRTNPAVFDHAVDIIANPGVILVPSYRQKVNPGTVITYTHLLTNTGFSTDTFSLTYIPGPFNWTQIVTPQVVTVGPGGSALIWVVVAVTDTAAVDIEDVVTLTAQSLAFVDVSDTITDATSADTIVSPRFVRVGGRDKDNNCSKLTDPCGSITQAYQQATGGDDIRVAQGEYTDRLSIKGKQVNLLGHWGTDFITRGITIDPSKTIINAQNTNRVLWIYGSATFKPIVDGFTFKNGRTSGVGGAVYIEAGMPVLANLIIQDSSTTRDGGGVYIKSGKASLNVITITNTSADGNGGGIYVEGGQPIIQKSRIYQTQAVTGGGVYIASGGTVNLWNNLIYNNTAAFGGGGVYNRDTVYLINDTLYNNHAGTSGGGVYYDDAGNQLIISNTIIVSNTAVISGGGVYRNGNKVTQVYYNDVWGNTPNNYSNVTPDSNNIATDPRFVDAAANDLHLQLGSPAVDTASPSTFLTDDFEGDLRPNDQGYDIGADELSGCRARIVDATRTYSPTAWYGSGPYAVLQTAINHAPDNHIIQIAGVCRGVNQRLISGQIVSQTAILSDSGKALTLEGGYMANFSTRDPGLYPTFIDPQGRGRALLITGTKPITFIDLNLVNGQAQGLSNGGGGLYNYNSTLLLAGVIISNSRATLGGGLYNVAGTLAFTSSDTYFVPTKLISNTAGSGGGMYLAGGQAGLTYAQIATNTAGAGGGVYNNGGVFDGLFLTVANNAASGEGGGIYHSAGQFIIQRSFILSNTASTNGGGLRNSAALTMVNSMIANNKATNGGGLYNQSVSLNLAARHNTFYANAASGLGGGIYHSANGVNIINSNIFADNTAPVLANAGIYRLSGSPSVLYNDLYPPNTTNFTLDGTNITGDPRFVSTDPANPLYLRLQTGSPAEDTADPASPVRNDIDNDPRPSNQGFDMGADEISTCYVRNFSTTIVYGSIQVAVDESAPYDFLQVAGMCQGVNTRDPGTGPVAQTVMITKSLNIRGGYTPTNWITSDPVANPTTLDALYRGRVVYVTGSPVVSMSGLNIRQGSGVNGGGIFVATGIVSLSENVVYSNTATNGGGLYNQSGSVYMFKDNQVYSNTANLGGGMYNALGLAVLDDNDWRGNNAGRGGAFYHNGGSSTLQNNIIRANNNVITGGGVYNNAAGLVVRHNTFYGNNLGLIVGGGGGFYTAVPNTTLVNNIFFNNAAANGRAIYGPAGFNPTYNDVYNDNTVTYPNTLLYGGGAVAGTGVLTANPRLLDPVNGDFHLQDTSPVIDKGDPAMSPIFDFEGDLRPGDQGFDMGADERASCLAKNITISPTVIYGNLQRAIDNSSSGDTILVAVGECRGVHRYNSISQTIHIDHRLTLFGQYARPTFIDPFRGYVEPNFNSQISSGMPLVGGNDVSTETNTILNATGLGRVLLITNSAVVTMEGFTLISGSAVGLRGGPSGGDAGGGLYVAAGSKGYLSFLRTYQSRAAYGGGVYNAGALTLHANKVITNSVTVYGGGIYNSGVLTLTTDGASADGTLAYLFATAIDNNVATSRGGGIYNQSGGDLRLINHEIDAPLDETGENEIFDQISGNRTTAQDGGGIYNEGGAILKSERFEISGNHSDGSGSNGGGLYNAGTANLDPGNKFHANYTQQNGGAIYNTGVLTLWNTLIYNNRATSSSGNGGGLYEASGNPNNILHNTFFNNQTQNGGGAVYIASGSNRTIKNNIFDDDSSNTNNGHAIRVGSGNVTVDYNDYWNMSLANAVSGTGIVTGTHSLTVDPLFVDADFHIGRDAAEPPGGNTDVVDAGEILTNVLYDFERDPRPINTSSDMGADEYKACLAQAWYGSGPLPPIRGRIMDALADAKLNGATTIRLAGQACVELVTIDQDIILQGSWERPEPGPDEDKINVRIDPLVRSPRIQAPYNQDGPVVDILPGTANNVRLEWLQLTYGHNPGGNGGGLRTIATNVTLDNMEVLSNSAQNGGGVYVGGGDVTISEVSFYSNRAQDCGGGFYASAGHTYLTGISAGYYLPSFPDYNENKAARGGGFCFEGPADIGVHNAWIQYNQATAGSGGGIYAANSGAFQVINTGFYSNTATADGGGLYRSSGGSNPALYHNTFRENTAQGQGGGVYNSGTPLLIKASIVASNIASTYSGVAGLANIDYTLRWANDYSVPATNEIPSGDPRFLAGYLYDLHYTSAAINKVPNAETTFNHDMVNEPRPMMCLKDGGADEYYVERRLQWLAPLAPANIGEVAPTQSFTHTFSLRNASIHWARLLYSPPGYELPGEGTGYPESLTITVQSTKPNWTHEIVGITGASNPVINGLTTTFTISPGAVVSISVKVTVPAGTFASIPTDSTTIDFTSLHYDSRYWGCAEVIDTGVPSLIAETRVKLDRSFVIVPDYITTTLYRPGDVIPYTHTLINTGNITDSYHLEGGSSRYGSGSPYPQEFYNVPPGMTRTIVFSVTLNRAAAGGLTDRTYLSGVSLDDVTVFASAYDETPIAYITGTRYVAANGNDEIFFDETDLVGYNISDNNCTQREQSPCRTLQHALNQAAPSDLIKLAGGTYNNVVTATYQGQLLNQMAFISKPVTLQGGFSPFAWDENPPNHTAHPTILNPQSQARVLYIAMTSPLTIEWLNLSGGDATGLGGGPPGSASAGGNIYNDGAPLTLRSVQLYYGSANMGGGLYISGSTLLLQNSMLHNNHATSSEGPQPKGGAVYVHNGAAWLQNDTFYANTSTRLGGSVYIDTGSLLVTNTIFATNTAPLGGKAIYNETASVAVDYNLYSNDDLFNVITGTHDLLADPRFVDLDTPDLHVQRGSPALDKANPATTLTTDYDNDLRPLPGPGLFDIGADERVQLPGVSLTPPYTVSAVAGSVVVLTHTLRNDGEFTDTYTLTFTHNQTASWTVNFGQVVPFTVTLGSGASRTIAVTYTIPAGSAGQVWLTVITATSAYNPNSAGVVADRIDVAAADWAIGKEVVPPDLVQAGGRLTYTLTLTNVGELDSNGTFTVSDELPANTHFVGAANPAPVLTSPVVQWVITNTAVPSYTGVMTFTYSVTVSRPLTQGTEIVNRVYTVTGGGAPNPSLGQPVTVTVVAPASLTATKTASDNPVQAGAYLTYTITVSNSAAAFGPAQNVVINDNLPVELALQSAEVVSPATGSVITVGNNVSWQLTSLIPAGGAAQVTVTVRVVSPLAANTILTNTYDVTAGNVLTPVSGFIATVVSSTNNITLNKTVNPISTPVNSLVNYVITLTNTGNGVALVNLTDTLSLGFTPASTATTVEVPGRTWDTPGVTVVSFNATTPPSLGVYPNRTITATYDLTRVVVTTVASVTVTAPPSGLIVQKVASSPFVQVGDAVVFTITAINSGAVTLTTVISDAQALGCSGSLGAIAPDYSPHSITCTVSNVRSTFTNTATAVATPTLGSVITESAAAVVTVVTPTLQVAKLPASQMVQNGGTAMFTISVTNTGNITLPLVTVADPQAPGCNNSQSDLGIGLPWQYTCSRAGVSASFTNTIIVTGTPPAGRVTTGTALARVQVISPAIRLSKLPASQTVAYNAPVTFTIIVTNSGDVTLTNIAVVDPLAPNCDRPGLGALAGGGVFTWYTCSVLTATVDFMNIATVTATPPVGSLAPVTATALVDVQAPNLAVTKLPASQMARYDGTVAFTITVTNTGDVTLTTVAISDTMATGCDASVTNLAPHAFTTTVCAMTNITANLTNTVVATGTSAGVQVTGAATATVQVISPSLQIDKSPDSQTVIYHNPVTFTIVVTNNGDVALTNVTVSDPLVPACGWSLGTLPPGARAPYTCVLTQAGPDFVNSATVTGTPPVGGDVIYTDTADVQVIGPELSITKLASAPEVLAGQVVTFTVTVTNTGDVTLTPVVITDALLPACGLNLPGGLAISATASTTCTATVSANLTNSATVTGASAGLEVTSAASATVIMIAPPTGVSISGPVSGWINTAYPFTATVSPLTTTLPLTYVWQAAGQTPITNTNVMALNNVVPFNWSTTGVKAITVTASNRLGTVSNTYAILVSACYAQVTSSGFTYPTVQEAVDASRSVTDVIKVAGYCDGVNYRASLSQTVYLSKTLTLRGGYNPLDWNVSDPAANPTTLDALNRGRVIYVTGNISPTIEGFQVISGNARGLGGYIDFLSTPRDAGNGIYVISATATITNNRIFKNGDGYEIGGGVHLESSPAIVKNNVITGNLADSGGGVSLCHSPALLEGNIIGQNSAGGDAGGVYLDRSDGILRHNTIISNTAPARGGGVNIVYGRPMLFDNLIKNNTASWGGGLVASFADVGLINNVFADNQGAGLYIYESSASLTQTTITRNNGAGVFVAYNAAVTLTNTILVSQTTGVYVNNIGSSTATLNSTLWYSNTANWGGPGAITHTNDYTGDPAFAADGYHLTAGSAAIDRGVNSGVPDDIDGDPRYFGLGYDLGADEYPGLLPPPTLIAPPNGTITNTHAITLEWSKVGALTYTLHLSGSVFNWPPGGGTTVVSPTVLPDGVYTWTVEAYDYFGRTSGVTATWVFTIDTSVPGITITKRAASQYALSGGTVNFTITVTNTGGNALNPVLISDTLVPACDRATTLNRGAVVSYTCAATVSADLTNTVVVTGTPPVGGVVTATASAAVVKIITPSIVITKTPDIQLIPSGGTARFTITVQNSGDITLTGVNVTDPLAPACNRPSLGTLARGVITTYACTITNVTAALINTAFVTGTHPAGGVVTQSDTAQVNVIHPALTIAKTPDTQIGYSGAPVTFTIYVTNTGDVTLTNVGVTDPLATNCSRPLSDLNPGVGASYSCSDIITTTGDITNIANASGEWAVGSVVTSDGAFVDYSPPGRPRLISPPNQTYTNNRNVTFVWSPMADAVTYTLNINGSTYQTTTTSYNFNFSLDGYYDWTVQSWDIYSRTLGYTATWRVTVDVTPPFSPTLIAPPNGVVISSTARPPFDWSDSTDILSGPVTYTVIITNSSGGVSRYNSGTTSAFTPTSNLPGGVYTWTVVAYDRAGNAGPSPDVFTVTVEIPLTGIYLPIIFKNYTAPPPRPDLVVTNMTVMTNTSGGRLVQVTVLNQSSVPVTVGNNFYVNVYQNSDFNNPIIIWGVQGAWFGAGQSRVLTQTYTFPVVYPLDAWADPYNVVVESDETNNRFTLLSGLSVEGGALPEPPLLPPGPLPTPTLMP